MAARGKEIRDGANIVKRKTALVVHQVLTTSTPVLSGRARANWLVERDATPAGTVGSPGKNPTDAPDPLPAGEAKINAAQPGEAIHIGNNLDYIGALNDGHSAQAPAGFVEQAVQIGVAAVRNAESLMK
jgi:hypothetical protein